MKITPISQRRGKGKSLSIPTNYHPPTTLKELRCRIENGETYFVNTTLKGELIEGLDLGNLNFHQSYFDNCTFQKCNFDQTVFVGASFQNAKFWNVKASHCIFNNADFYKAVIEKSVFIYCDFFKGCFINTEFRSSGLVGNSFNKAWFGFTKFFRTPFSFNDFSDTVHPSSESFCFIDINSIHMSAEIIEEHFNQQWNEPDMLKRQREVVESQENISRFLSRCGLPPEAYLLYQEISSSSKHDSVFISYSSNDEIFARELHTELQKQGIDVWFAPHDMEGGKKIIDQVTNAINEKNRVILILSEHSMKSGWVSTEIRKASRASDKYSKLFPIRLVDYEKIQNWELFDSDIGEDLAVHIRSFFIPDFTNWNDSEVFALEITKLSKALKKEVEKN